MPFISVPIHYVIWLTLRLFGHKVALLAYALLAGLVVKAQDGSARVFLGALRCFLVLGYMSNSVALAIAPKRLRMRAAAKAPKALPSPPRSGSP